MFSRIIVDNRSELDDAGALAVVWQVVEEAKEDGRKIESKAYFSDCSVFFQKTTHQERTHARFTVMPVKNELRQAKGVPDA